MTITVCPINPPGHDWEAGLSCRWCDATRTPGEAVLSGLASVRGWSREAARAVRDAYRAEVVAAGARLIEDAACDADWSATPAYCQGLRAGAELLLANTGERATPAGVTAAPAPDVRSIVHAALSTVQGTTHHLGLVTLELLTDRVTEAVAPLVSVEEKSSREAGDGR